MSINTNEKYTLCIIIPNYNGSKYIEAMLDSIISNDYNDWKCIIVDDGSTDNSIDILKKITEKEPRITYCERNRMPKGAQTCRNIGFEKSIGAEYVIWFDNDDLIAPYCLRQRVEYMEKHPELDFAIFPAKGFITDKKEKSSWYTGIQYPYNEMTMFLHHKLPYVVWCNIYRRKVLQDNSIIWDERLLSLQDSDFNIQGLIHNLKHKYAIQENIRIDYFYRIKGDGISSKILTNDHIDSHLYLLEKTYSTLRSSKYNVQNEDICINILRFLDNFRFLHNSIFCHKLIKLSWFKYHPIITLKLLIYLKLKKGEKILFYKAVKRDENFKTAYNNIEKNKDFKKMLLSLE